MPFVHATSSTAKDTGCSASIDLIGRKNNGESGPYLSSLLISWRRRHNGALLKFLSRSRQHTRRRRVIYGPRCVVADETQWADVMMMMMMMRTLVCRGERKNAARAISLGASPPLFVCPPERLSELLFLQQPGLSRGQRYCSCCSCPRAAAHNPQLSLLSMARRYFTAQPQH